MKLAKVAVAPVQKQNKSKQQNVAFTSAPKQAKQAPLAKNVGSKLNRIG